MIAFTFGLVILLALGVGLLSRRGASDEVGDFLVGSRSFGPLLFFVLGAGESYSIGTLIGFPGGLYAGGASYGVWFVSYILLGYCIGYLYTPYLWAAGKRYGAMTLPDVGGSHFRSRGLELTLAISFVAFLIPWGQLQLGGLQAAMSGLGLRIDPTVAALAGAALALVFLMLSGLRAPAFVSYVKDAALLLSALFIGVAAITKAGGTQQLFADVATTHADSHFTITGSRLTFAVTTILFQAVGFYAFPFIAQTVFTSRSVTDLKKVMRLNPLYMLMYPFLVAAAFSAITLVPDQLTGAQTNNALMLVSRLVLPDWATGIVAAGAALCAVVVLCGTALGIGAMVSRNIVPGIPESRQRSTVRIVIVVYMVVSLLLTLAFPRVLLALVNTAYFGITQTVIVFAAMVFGWKLRPMLMATGIIIGDILVLWWYLDTHGPISRWLTEQGINLGLAAFAVNALFVLVTRFIWPATNPVPGMRSYLQGRLQAVRQEVA